MGHPSLQSLVLPSPKVLSLGLSFLSSPSNTNDNHSPSQTSSMASLCLLDRSHTPPESADLTPSSCSDNRNDAFNWGTKLAAWLLHLTSACTEYTSSRKPSRPDRALPWS